MEHTNKIVGVKDSDHAPGFTLDNLILNDNFEEIDQFGCN